jgi:hypothetical protein
MPDSYRAPVDARRFLNFPEFHDGAYIVVYVEDTSRREVTWRVSLWRPESRARHLNPQPRLVLEIADARTGSISSSSSTASFAIAVRCTSWTR